MFEQILESNLPSSDQLLKVVQYAVAALVCIYAIIGTFFFVLYVKRKKNQPYEVAVVTPRSVLIHNNSVQKWLKLVFSEPSNDNFVPELTDKEVDNAFGGILFLE